MVKKENTEYDEKIEEIKKDKDYYLKEIKELKKMIDRYKLFESERNRYENEANTLKVEYDTFKRDVSKKLIEVEGIYQKDIENLKCNLKTLEKENNSLNDEVKRLRINDSSTNSSKNFEANSNNVNYSSLSTKSCEENNLKQMFGNIFFDIEKSNETIDHYKNEMIKREKLFEEQEIFLTNMIFNLSRELIFSRFINNE